MRYFLLLAFVLFFAPSKAQVVVPDSVASYFLEAEAKEILLEQEIITLQAEITNLKSQVGQKTVVATEVTSETVDYKGIIAEKEKQLTLKQDEYKILKKEIRHQKVMKYVAYGVAVLALIIAFLHG